MNILLFTHQNDIDGMGSIVLSKLAFQNVDYIACKTFDLPKKFTEFINNQKIYNYDKIFITDLCLEENLLKFINEDEILKHKIVIIDHHETYNKEKYTRYPFVNIKIRNEKGLCSGTSLFYEYLIQNELLKETNIILEFVELTRQHDTWEWKNIYHNEKSRELAILFDTLGLEGYIDFLYEKLKTQQEFNFTKIESILINNKKIEINNTIKEYLKNIHYKNILGLKGAIFFINYEFRNELADYLKDNNYDIDFVMMISLDKESVSYRSIKSNVSVRKIAEYFNGKSHDVAATNPITAFKQNEIIKILTKK